MAQTERIQGEEKPKKRHLVRNIVIIVAIVVIIAVIALVAAFATGVLSPVNAAAKYGSEYLDEQDVTDYIMTYKKQMGYENASDEEWATFLAAYNLTPDRLRLSTIEELLMDKAIEQECEKQGITVSDDEVDAMINNLIDSTYFGDEETFKADLEASGQTEEGYRDVCYRTLLRQKLRQTVETPEPTEDEVRSYIEEYAATCQADEAAEAETTEQAEEIRQGDGSILLRHSYCFSYITDGEPGLSDYNTVEAVKQEFIGDGLSADNFMLVLGMYSNDEDAIASNGEMGWDAGTDEYSETYIRMLDATDVDSVSDTFTDGDAVCFIYVDKSYTLPYSQEKIEELDLSEMPESLYEYFSDCEAYELWYDASNDYLTELLASMNVVLYEMPADVPYNVDMSPYLVEESDETSESTGSESSEDSVGNESSASSAGESGTGNESSASESSTGESSADESGGE